MHRWLDGLSRARSKQKLLMLPRRKQTNKPPGADAKEDAMRSIQEIIFSLMTLVGLSMIVYDVINARGVARAAEPKNLLNKKPVSLMWENARKEPRNETTKARQKRSDGLSDGAGLHGHVGLLRTSR